MKGCVKQNNFVNKGVLEDTTFKNLNNNFFYSKKLI